MFKKIMFYVVATLLMAFIAPATPAHAIPERNDIIASISFQLDDSTNTQNARRATEIINGTILQPNEEFSFNKIVGRRTAANGFIPGHYPVRENGKIIDYYVYGSGVCRASSGAHYVALEAGLNITEAWRHDVRVSYIEYGKDAAVDWGSADLRFINNKTFPIKIIIFIDGANVLKAQIIRAN